MFNKCFLSENRAVYEIMWKRIVQLDNVAHTHCRLNTRGYKHTLRICNTSCFTTTAVVKWTQFNVTFYVLCRYSVI